MADKIEWIAAFGTGNYAYGVYLDRTFMRPYCIGRINAKDELIIRVANRRTEAEAIAIAKEFACVA